MSASNGELECRRILDLLGSVKDLETYDIAILAVVQDEARLFLVAFLQVTPLSTIRGTSTAES